MEALLVFAASFITILIVILIFLAKRRAMLSDHQELESLRDLQIIPPEGIRIPITQSFSGYKPFAAFGLSHNNMNPLLILFDDHIEYRVILKNSKRFGDIEYIKPIMNRQLRFVFYGSFLTLSVWLRNAEDRTTLLNFLSSRGVNVVE